MRFGTACWGRAKSRPVRVPVTELPLGVPLLLYDGDCGFCRGSVRFILAHERKGTLHFASLAGTLGRRFTARFPELAGVNSLVWFEPFPGEGQLETRVQSAALLAVASYLGGPWKFLGLFRIVPGPVRDFAYRLMARHRSYLPGESDRCSLPTENQRSRFLDDLA